MLLPLTVQSGLSRYWPPPASVPLLTMAQVFALLPDRFRRLLPVWQPVQPRLAQMGWTRA